MGNRRRNASLYKSCFCCREVSPPPSNRALKHELHRSSSRKEKDGVLRNRENTSAGVYEDMMLYVKQQPASSVGKRRGRGRPKKMPEGRQITANGQEIIYLPSTALKKDTCKIIPLHALVGRRFNVTRRVQNPDQGKNVIDWSDDLYDLVDNWDNLPENKERLLVKWLVRSPLNVPYPPAVQRIHEMIEEWPGTIDKKILEMESFLREIGELTTPCPPANLAINTDQPKVVVKVEPVPLQNCGQWSSMAGSDKNCQM